MANLPISEALAEKLQAIARQQNRPLEEFLEAVITQLDAPNPIVDVNVPKDDTQADTDDIEDDPRYQAARKRIMPNIYARARKYWQTVGNQERLALTDTQLDEQFWCIDLDGIPRLKSDQGQITLPFDPMIEAAKQAERQMNEAGQGHLIASEHVDTRKILNNEFPDYLSHRIQASDGE